MKILLSVIFLIFINISSFVFAEEWTLKYSGISSSEVIDLTNGSKIINLNNTGTWEDSFGNYGKGRCLGLVVLDTTKDVTSNSFYCELIDQDDDSYFIKGYRETELTAGVGKYQIIDGNGKWKDYIGAICTYGIKFKDEALFSAQKCNK